jgi:molybdopterin biosynthesis enzyme MoaB
VTVEAHRDVYEKEIEAFGTIFALVSYETIGTSAVQSRATGAWRTGPTCSRCREPRAPAATPGTAS